ncbi:hypothetical protein C5167_022879 [Papaver somniferum]|uniref:LOB domain-containing protein n=1 Tax=Papaver somniferum TaxID=3469 RepID=A0A4Y7JMX3_PAPSO|nr:LOB domain-containing protein 41-like [Papaver somniferum]RZC61138.1 hypothetical protein C5167_022879 [Papaver somniferum]
MRMSCNGCRVLRKGCSENCSIRPCLQWIKSPESQANATVFLAKFYGRAGLMNLINSGPEHLRPAIFRSLLYEACGRIVNPIYGSVGLLWSGSWQLCQAAVEAVLKGAPIMQIPSEAAVSPSLPFKGAYDIRHVSKDDNSAASQELTKVKTRNRFKRSSTAPVKLKPVKIAHSPTESSVHHEPIVDSDDDHNESTQLCNLDWNRSFIDELNRDTSHDSSNSHQGGYSRESESMFSVETVEASMVSSRAEQEHVVPQSQCHSDDSEVELELSLGFESSRLQRSSPAKKQRIEMDGSDIGGRTCKIELGLDFPV